MNNLPRLYVPVGVPGCGKTSFYKKYFATSNLKYVSRDEIRLSLIKDDDEYFQYEKEVFRRYIFEIADHLKKGESVYADATHLNFPSRAKLMSGLASMGLTWDKYDVVFIYFDVPLDTCLERNKLREGRGCVPEDVIMSMYNNMTEPTKKEFLHVIDEWRISI